jgi:small multidrug resistance family-3 protein
MTVARSLILFAAAALAEICGAWLVWQGVREHRGWLWIGAGMIALGTYGLVATLQPDANFGRILRRTAACSLRARSPGAWLSMVSGQTDTTWPALSSA